MADDGIVRKPSDGVSRDGRCGNSCHDKAIDVKPTAVELLDALRGSYGGSAVPMEESFFATAVKLEHGTTGKSHTVEAGRRLADAKSEKRRNRNLTKLRQSALPDRNNQTRRLYRAYLQCFPVCNARRQTSPTKKVFHRAVTRSMTAFFRSLMINDGAFLKEVKNIPNVILTRSMVRNLNVIPRQNTHEFGFTMEARSSGKRIGLRHQSNTIVSNEAPVSVSENQRVPENTDGRLTSDVLPPRVTTTRLAATPQNPFPIGESNPTIPIKDYIAEKPNAMDCEEVPSTTKHTSKQKNSFARPIERNFCCPYNLRSFFKLDKRGCNNQDIKDIKKALATNRAAVQYPGSRRSERIREKGNSKASSRV